MTSTTVLAVVLASSSVLTWGADRGGLARSRLRAVAAGSSGGAVQQPDGLGGRGGATSGRTALTAPTVAVAVGLASVAFWLGDPVLLVAAVSTGGAVLWFTRRRGVAATHRARAAVVAALPVAADLLAACLSSGAPATEALSTVADMTTGPLGHRLQQVAAAMRLGADAAEAWGPLGADDPLAPLGRAFVRSTETGAPIARMVAAVADEQRRAQRWAAEAAARRAGVQAVGPLAVCFLPAFVLIGIVPLVMAVAGEVLTDLR